MTDKRHVLVEGPDGSGKTTLVNFLVANTPLKLHARASDSIGGPVANLQDWVVNDERDRVTHLPSVYDRHPVISEPIYSRFARGVRPAYPFDNMTWVRNRFDCMQKDMFVVICLPPYREVVKNVENSPQMNGVVKGIADIYAAYSNLQNYFGLYMYDYTVHLKASVLTRVHYHLNGVFL